jgi:hypothetical protein
MIEISKIAATSISHSKASKPKKRVPRERCVDMMRLRENPPLALFMTLAANNDPHDTKC